MCIRDSYTGAWLNGNKHGFGRLTWTSGDYWEGEFRDGQQTDNGQLQSSQSRAEKHAEKAAAPPDKDTVKKRGK